MRYGLIGLILLALGVSPAAAQAPICFKSSASQIGCTPVTTTTSPLPVTGTFSPSGTQSVNIAQILGAAPSLTNPLWVFPATGATFPVSGTFFQATQPVSGTFFQATQPVSIAAAPLNAIGITPTDRTVTSATGASQTMMAANAARHSLTIVNTGNANCGVNPTGGTAAIGGAGTLTLAPLGAFTPRIPTLSAVTVICTAAQPIYGDES